MNNETEINKHPATDAILAAAALLHRYRGSCWRNREIDISPYYCGCEDEARDAQHTRHVVMRWRVIGGDVTVRCYSIGRYYVDGGLYNDALDAASALRRTIAAVESTG